MNKLIQSFWYLVLLFGMSCTHDAQKSSESALPELPVSGDFTKVDLDIVSPDYFSSTISAAYLFQDSLHYILPGKPKDKIFVLNLSSGLFETEITLDPNFFSNPSGIHVHSPDSIFVSEFMYPVIYLINQAGEILDSYDLYRETLWDMPAEGFANFGLYTSYGKTFVYNSERNSFLIPLKQQDLWYFVERKKDFPVLAEYSLETKDFAKLFGRYEGVYRSAENYMLPFFLSHPIIEVTQKEIILSFSYDPYLYIYSLDGEFVVKKEASVSDFWLGMPLRYDMNNYDEEGMSEFSRRNSYFTDFFYVAEEGKYIRIFNECVPDVEGLCKARNIFALVFDESLNLIDKKLIGKDFANDYYSRQFPYANGFISKIDRPASDDVFSFNDYFILD
ncbi:hypothetical protein [Algoriphagus namhaensis]